MTKKQKKLLLRIIITSVILLGINFLPITVNFLRFGVYLIPYLIIGHDILLKSFKGICNGQIFDENFLMSIATIGAFIIGIVKSGDYLEAVAVMLFYQIGEFFQNYAVRKSRKNICDLMDIRPDYANIEINGEFKKVDPYEIEIGSLIIVTPGEKIPIDGIVEDGISCLNTSALTGESIPRYVKPGDNVISGCINMTGVLKIRTIKNFEESTVSKILELVENASSRKSKSENLVSKFAKIYTPTVCFSALALATVPPIINIFTSQYANWSQWIYRALSFLVASCPCALVIGIPLTYFAGIGGASKEGILIKGSNYLEALSKTEYVVFDKTGTLTKGMFDVSAIHHNILNKDMLIEYAALAENASTHPIGKSIIKTYGKEIDNNRICNVHEISGCGIIAGVDGKEVAVGNDKLMKTLNIEYLKCHKSGTIIHTAINGEYAGHIVISDTIKPSSEKTITELKNIGIKEIVMLTGDTEQTASQVAEKLKIDIAYSELLPEDKVSKIEEIINKKPKNKKLAFVGDGINDAPVLSRADIGIAMGAMGSDAAIEAADIVLMDDDPIKIAKTIKISRKCLKIVYQNIIVTIGVKVLTLVLIALGISNMWMAVFADVGIMILAILNAIRALFVKNI